MVAINLNKLADRELEAMAYGKSSREFTLAECLDNGRYSMAVYSTCGIYRYALSRRWSFVGGIRAYVMLNPSTATELENDPTVERCERRARQDGFGCFVVINLFALRSTDPRALRLSSDPVGPLNDAFIIRTVKTADEVVCGWGEYGKLLNRSEKVRAILLDHARDKLNYLKLNASGEPSHPLYLPYELKPTKWELSCTQGAA